MAEPLAEGGMTAVDNFGNEAADPEERRREDRWHVGREIPLAIIIMLALQTIGGVWWLAQLSFRLDKAVETIKEFRDERYTREDARRDRELMMLMFGAQKQTDLEHERRLDALERTNGLRPPKP